jgi:hypothetical protein
MISIYTGQANRIGGSYGTGVMQLVFQCHVKFSIDLVDSFVMVEVLATRIILEALV